MQPHGILETIIYADDLSEIKQFYSEVLGLDVVDDDPPHHIFFRCGDSLFLVFNPHKSIDQETEVDGTLIPQHGAHGPCHMAFRVNAEELPAWKEKLSAHHVPIESEINWPNGGKSLYFRDPVGNSIELATAKLWGVG